MLEIAGLVQLVCGWNRQQLQPAEPGSNPAGADSRFNGDATRKQISIAIAYLHMVYGGLACLEMLQLQTIR